MYEFSLGSFILGIALMAAGAAMVYFHKQLSQMFMGGPGMYSKYKLYGLMVSILGILLLFNIPQLVLEAIVRMFFGC